MQAGLTNKEEKVNIVIIGAGDIAQKRHIPAILASKYGNLTGIYNRNHETTRELAAKYGLKAYESLNEILTDKAVDAVLISTPTDSHCEIAVNALNAGKHVLLEKPMTLNTQSAREIEVAVKRTGKKLMLLHIQRYYDQHKKLKEIIDSGQIGKVLSIRSTLGNNDRSILNGVPHLGWQDALFNVGIHRIDLMSWLIASNVEGVFCKRNRLLVIPDSSNKREIDDHAIGIIQYENGVIGTLITSRTSFHGEDRSTIIIGTKGCVSTFTNGHDVVVRNLEGEETYFDFRSTHAQGVWEYTDIHDRFFEAVLKDMAPEVDEIAGVNSVRIAEAMEISDREKRYVYLSEL